MHPYLPFAIYPVVALLIPVLISVLAGILGPKKPEPAKYLPYESGHPTPPLQGRFPVHFYLVAMLFVIFDVEAAAFYPWAIKLRELGAFALWEMLGFVFVLAIGYAYVWKKGGFSWK